MARLFIGLPYLKSDIVRKGHIYCSENTRRQLKFKADYTIGESIGQRDELDYWLTERHALYQQNGNKLHRIDIHHKLWPLRKLYIEPQISGYPMIANPQGSLPDCTHYAEELEVLVWGRVTVS